MIVFGNPGQYKHVNITNMIRNTSAMILAERFPNMEYASVLLEQLLTRYQALNWNQEPSTSGPLRGVTQRPEQVKRNKRGLFNFVGTLANQLFGVETEEHVSQIKQMVDKNRDTLLVITHQSNKMLSIVNATRLQMIENRKAVNELIKASAELRDWVVQVRLRQHLYHVLMFRISMIQDIVTRMERMNDKMLSMRKDLERGILSEVLLPIESLRSLINSPAIPKGSKFVSPLYWYYSNLSVKMINMGDELIYSIDLPLVSEEHGIATQFKSFPTPNVNRNITLQIDVKETVLYNRHTGREVDLHDNCIGSHPLVCLPMPIKRKDQGARTCGTALSASDQSEVTTSCPVKVAGREEDKLFVHEINSFVVVTWGTDVREGCLHNKVLTLQPGTYLIEWSGKCPLCTQQHCVPGVVRMGSTLRLENTWQNFPLPKVQHFSNLNVTMRLPQVMATPEVIPLGQLTIPEEPGIVWSQGDTSLTIDVMIVVIIICVCIGVCIYYYYVKRGSFSVKTNGLGVDAQLPMLTKTEEAAADKSDMLTPQEAAAILLTSK